MSNHTAGPWEWNDKDQLIAVSVKNSIETGEDEEDRFPEVIIETDSGFYPPRGPDRKLLAAAPDMLAALQAARVEVIDLCVNCNCSSNSLAQIDAAILEATGGMQ